MQAANLPRELRLAQRAVYHLPDARGIELECREGSLWVTIDGDLRDYIVEAGETFRTTGRRHAIVYALEPSHIRMWATGARREVRPRGLQIESARRPSHVFEWMGQTNP